MPSLQAALSAAFCRCREMEHVQVHDSLEKAFVRCRCGGRSRCGCRVVLVRHVENLLLHVMDYLDQPLLLRRHQQTNVPGVVA